MYYIEQKLFLAVTRIGTWVASATTKSTNHYTITATEELYTFDLIFNKKATKFFIACK